MQSCVSRQNTRPKKKGPLWEVPFWCAEGDSNSHGSPRYHLKIVCLPVPPSALERVGMCATCNKNARENSSAPADEHSCAQGAGGASPTGAAGASPTGATGTLSAGLASPTTAFASPSGLASSGFAVALTAGLPLFAMTEVEDEPKNDRVMLVSMKITAAPAVSLARKVLAPRPPKTVCPPAPPNAAPTPPRAPGCRSTKRTRKRQTRTCKTTRNAVMVGPGYGPRAFRARGRAPNHPPRPNRSQFLACPGLRSCCGCGSRGGR